MVANSSDPRRPQAIWPSGRPEPSPEGEALPYSPATRAENWVFVSGHLASDDVEDVAPEARTDPGWPFHADAFELQARYVFKQLARTLTAASSSFGDVVETCAWLVVRAPGRTAANQWHEISLDRFARVRQESLGTAQSGGAIIGVGELLVRNTRLEIDVTAMIPAPGETREPIPVSLSSGMSSLYSAGTRVGGWVFLSGGLPVDWQICKTVGFSGHGETPVPALAGENWYERAIRAQTDRALTNLATFAEAAGTTLDDAVKATVYLADPRDYLDFEDVWRGWFPTSPPARTIITGVSPAWPGARVEVTLTCIVPGPGLCKSSIETSAAPEPLGHQPQAVRAGSFLFLSGQMAADSNGVAAGVVPDPRFPYYGSRARQQMSCILGNVDAICGAAGTSLTNICRRRAFHLDLSDSVYSIEEWAAHFSGDKPASTTIRIGGPLLAPGCDVLLDLVAWVP